MTSPLHVPITTPPSAEKPPIITVGTNRILETQPLRSNDLDTKISFEKASRKRKCSQSCGSSDGDSDDGGHDTIREDGHSSSMDDVCKLPETQDEGQKLASHSPSKIVHEARNKFKDALRSGSSDGIEVLENDLEVLRKESVGASDLWKIGEAELLLDLGRKVEAREALALCDTQQRDRGANAPIRRPTLRKSPSAIDAQFNAHRSKFNNMSDQELEELVKVSLRAEDWTKAREAAETLHRIDSTFFDIQRDMDRYRKCRQILVLGGLEETRDHDPDLGKALRLYNHGCFAIELFHKHFDPPQAQVNGLDHEDSANLFFAAARVCVQFHDFHQNGYRDPPPRGYYSTPELFTRHFKRDKLPCSPPLTEKDWEHQALHFMAQGRSRALRESILRGDPEQPIVTAIQRKYLMVDVAIAAEKTNRIKKRRDSLLAADSQSSTFMTNNEASQEYSLLGLSDTSPPALPIINVDLEGTPQRNTRPLALAPLLDTTGLDDYHHAQTLLSPSSFEDSETGSTKEKAFAKLQAQMRWQKALLYALAKRKFTLIAALPSSSFVRDASRIETKIPADTAVIEYALVTAPPEGLISIVITSRGITKCSWQGLDTLEIQRTVADLLGSMQSPSNTRTRNFSPTSPRKRAFVNARELQETLFDKLIRPIQDSLEGKEKLIVVPSGELAHVPWTLLLKLPVCIVPSLSIWDHLHSHPRDSPSPSKVSVVGNPPKNKDGSLRNGDIPFSYIEAFYIARSNQSFPFLAGENNREQFQDWLSTTRSLHVCAHSTFDTKDPARSGTDLFSDPLTIHDWRDLAIKADLVVFSSCLSSFSKAFHSGSSFGFAHALLSTGTRAFIGSLWPVDDQATLLLMMIFYEQLRTFSPAEALHNAQMKMCDLTENDVWDYVMMLRDKVDHEEVGKYIERCNYWINRLADLKAEDLEIMREPRCWAAFVVTGYGFQHI